MLPAPTFRSPRLADVRLPQAGGCVAAPPLTGGHHRRPVPHRRSGMVRLCHGGRGRPYEVPRVDGQPDPRRPAVPAAGRRRPGGGRLRVSQVEHQRRAVGRFASADNLYNFTSAPITKGSDNVWEAFTELEFPILQERSVRGSTDHQRFGPLHGLQVVRFGHDLQDRRSLLADPLAVVPRQLRHVVPCAGAVRAVPGIDDGLPARRRPILATICSTSPTRRSVANCLADGLPTELHPEQRRQRSSSVAARTPGLEAETSKNLTFGVVSAADAWPGLRQPVARGRLLPGRGEQRCVPARCRHARSSGCYNGTRPEYCQFVSRAPFTGPGTGAAHVTQTYINVATDIVKGIDFVLRYDRELGPGKLDIGVQAVRIIGSRQPDRSGLRGVRTSSGSIGNPKWAGTGHIGYDLGPWYARWGVDYIKGTDDQPFLEDLGYDPAESTTSRCRITGCTRRRFASSRPTGTA